MKSDIIILITGIIMLVLGLILFYSIQSEPNVYSVLKSVKHAGTFVGLMGIGVLMAGILLNLINRNQPRLEGFDTDIGN